MCRHLNLHKIGQIIRMKWALFLFHRRSVSDIDKTTKLTFWIDSFVNLHLSFWRFYHKQLAYLKKFNEFFLWRFCSKAEQLLNLFIRPLFNVSWHLDSSTRYFFLKCSSRSPLLSAIEIFPFGQYHLSWFIAVFHSHSFDRSGNDVIALLVPPHNVHITSTSSFRKRSQTSVWKWKQYQDLCWNLWQKHYAGI